jgi:NAD(P)-dependent dehydrogenase (short-subunit alcohol dehydrogenase family)
MAIGSAGQHRVRAVTDSMRGRVCLITGATSGIGKATAHALAAMGASVVLIGRNLQKGEAAAAQEIREDTGNEEVELLRADLTSQTSIRELADHVLAEHDQLHVLVNCAGAFFRDRQVTIDGLEMTFALNHLAYFLLTTLLLDLLQESAPARIVNVTSGAHSAASSLFPTATLSFIRCHRECKAELRVAGELTGLTLFA